MPDDVVQDGGAAPDAGADAGGSEGAAAQQAAPDQGGTQPGPGPWASDLERFPEEVRGDVDAYLRETWQPRVTQLEQSAMPDEIGTWLQDLNDPEMSDQAFMALAYELYGEDALPFFQTALQYVYGDESGVVDNTGLQPEDFTGDEGFEIELDPEDRAAIDFIKEQREDAAYDGALRQVFDAFKDDFPTDDFETNKGILSPFVYAADGDLEQGYRMYTQWLDQVAEAGGDVNAAADALADGVAPEDITPQTLGAQGQNPAGPTIKQGQSLGDAVKDMLADMSASKGPPALG